VRFLRSIAALFAAPPLALGAAIAIFISDLIPARRRLRPDTMPRTDAASIVIPNWDGRELLAKYLPSVIQATSGNPANEIIVVDNGSEDGSAQFVREQFPTVRLLALEKNLGFGGGSNAGVAEARNDIVVLLNSDMRVAPDFLAPLLEAFTNDKVFAVSCQIFFTDPDRRREETGLTEGRWHRGKLQVGHRIDDRITEPFPCFYGGGGSCAFDRRKFLELGGFDEIFAPFYFEDADLGYLAWKRGWQVLYQPRSVVWHEHRGTIGRHFSDVRIAAVLGKNTLLFCWKNIHEWPKLAEHFAAVVTGAVLRGRLRGIWRAVIQLPGVLSSRRRARGLATISDTEAFRRPRGGYFRDRLAPAPQRLSVLFLSPYSICPPVHGGSVFMYNTLRELVRHCDVHVLVVLDRPEHRAAHAELEELVASVEYVDRLAQRDHAVPYYLPYAVRNFAYRDIEWAMNRIVCARGVDVLQLEYTNMAQYAREYRRLVCALFEHDIYFQSVGRRLTAKAAWEYLRALRFELRSLAKIDLVQVCTRANRDYLVSFAPKLAPRIETGSRTGIDVQQYSLPYAPREPLTMLFLGSFRHAPNLEGFEWFRSGVLPRVRARYPNARAVVVGSEMEHHEHPDMTAHTGVELRGFVSDVREPLARYAVLVCSVLSGSGVRVKLLEAFAAGIPSVSTRIGAEGISANDGELCRLADEGEAFANAIVDVFENPDAADAMVRRARKYVENEHDSRKLTEKLVESYRGVVERKRS
jgi:GT2 family glycosyltransferase/glycosyltransferase involved in cell wall biosynthesis